METQPRKFIIAELSIRKLGSSSVLIKQISLLSTTQHLFFTITKFEFDVQLQRNINNRFFILTTDLNYWIKHPFEFSDPILKPEYL